jgi:hypothetical protein
MRFQATQQDRRAHVRIARDFFEEMVRGAIAAILAGPDGFSVFGEMFHSDSIDEITRLNQP